MRTLLSRAIQVDPGFHVALGIIVVVGVAEIFFASSYYVGRARTNRLSGQMAAITNNAGVHNLVSFRSPAPSAAPQTKTTPVQVLNTPVPSIVDQLLREGKEFRERGDTTNALAHFQEALDGEPDNIGVLQEMAQTYESMQLFDRANDIWRRVKQISASDSATYALADRRLKIGVPAPPAVETGGAPAEGDVPSRKDVGGNADGPIMGISDVKIKETPDPEAETNLALEIGIKKQPGAVIDHNKVKILVFLYDVVNDKDIKLTDADVSNEWLTTKHDWSDTNPEVLLVRYVRAKTGGALSESSLSEAAAKVRPGQKPRGSKGPADMGQRKYLGYIVRVYYDDDLQAVQAEPSRLLQQFPSSKNPSAR
jgi:tetratricopeptide (TPR) repeat protein